MRFSILSILTLFFLFSCEDDTPTLPQAQLSLDGANLTAPILAPGTHQACARFTTSALSDYVGQSISSVDMFFQSEPTIAKLKIYQGQGNTVNIPGNELLDLTITNDIRTGEFTTFTIPNPVNIGLDDLWICAEVFHTNQMGSIGCDIGPALPNGDWYRSISDNTWLTFREQTNNEADINWNIRARVE